MNDGSRAFEVVALELERRSAMSRLEARGTLRLALKEAGLLPKSVSRRDMLAVLEKILPEMLARRRVKDPAETCQALAASIVALSGSDTADTDTPEMVFARIGGTPATRRWR